MMTSLAQPFPQLAEKSADLVGKTFPDNLSAIKGLQEMGITAGFQEFDGSIILIGVPHIGLTYACEDGVMVTQKGAEILELARCKWPISWIASFVERDVPVQNRTFNF